MAATELLGRDRELRAFDGLVAQAADGEARLVVIEGAAGIGKTRLLGEARRRAEAAGMRALSARATRRSSSGPRTPPGCTVKARVDPDGTVVANHPV